MCTPTRNLLRIHLGACFIINEVTLLNNHYNNFEPTSKQIKPIPAVIELALLKSFATRRVFTLADLFVLNFEMLSSDETRKACSYSKCANTQCSICFFSRPGQYLNLKGFPLFLKSAASCSATCCVYILHCRLCNIYFIGQTQSFPELLQAMNPADMSAQGKQRFIVAEHFAQSFHNVHKHFSFWIFKDFQLHERTSRRDCESFLYSIFRKLDLKMLHSS